MSRRWIGVILSGWLLLPSGSSAQAVVHCPYQDAALSERWKWALEDGKRSAGSEELWVGYCIRRLMSENAHIISENTRSREYLEQPTLREIITGVRSPKSTVSASWDVKASTTDVMVLKEVAILIRLSGDVSGSTSIQKLTLSDLDMHFDLKNKPLIWLAGTDDDQSIQFLTALYPRIALSQTKKEVVNAIGLHERTVTAFPFLSKTLGSEEPDDVRSQAAFWIGQQDSRDALNVLLDAAQKDRSSKVREQAVFAISLLPGDESTEALIDLARKGGDTKTRGKAVFWLGQKASQKAVATLEKIVMDDAETEVQRQALFALAQMHDGVGVDRLIAIAETHPNARIRKQAIQCLGQSEDPRTLEALIKIVRK